MTYPILRLTWHRLQEHVVYSPCASEVMSHRSISETEATDFSPPVGVIVNLKRFAVLLDDKLFIIKLHLLFSCLFFVEEER